MVVDSLLRIRPANFEGILPIVPNRHNTVAIRQRGDGVAVGLQIWPQAQAVPSGLHRRAVFAGALSESQVRTVMAGDFSAFLNTTPLLSLYGSGAQLILSWGFGILQSASDINGAWQDEAGARPPMPLNPGEARRFYRVVR